MYYSFLAYSNVTRIMYRLAKEAFDNENTYFPIWGTCWGFQELVFLSNNETILREHCVAHNLSLPLKFTNEWPESKFAKETPIDIATKLSEKAVTFHNHGFCVTPDEFKEANLDKKWRILGTGISYDNIGKRCTN